MLVSLAVGYLVVSSCKWVSLGYRLVGAYVIPIQVLMMFLWVHCCRTSVNSYLYCSWLQMVGRYCYWDLGYLRGCSSSMADKLELFFDYHQVD